MASEYRFYVRVVIVIIAIVALVVAENAAIHFNLEPDLPRLELAGLWLWDQDGLYPIGASLLLLINGLIGVGVFKLTGLIPFGHLWQRHGRCCCCGYDLRGGTGDTCPECGDRSSPG